MQHAFDEIEPDTKRVVVDAGYGSTKLGVKVVDDKLKTGSRGGDTVDTVWSGKAGESRLTRAKPHSQRLKGEVPDH